MISLILFMAMTSLPPVTCVSVAAALGASIDTYHQRVFQTSEPVRDILCIKDGQCLEVHTGDPGLRTVSIIDLSGSANDFPPIQTSMESADNKLPLAFAIDRDRVMSAQIIKHRDRITLSIFDASLKQEIYTYDVTSYFDDKAVEELPNGLIPRAELLFSHDGQILLLVTSKAIQAFEFSNRSYRIGAGFVTARADIRFAGFYDREILGVDSKGLTLHGNGYIPLVLDSDSPLPTSPIAIWNGNRSRIIARPRSESETRLGVYRIRQIGNTRRPNLELEGFIPNLPHGDGECASGPDAIWIFKNSLWSYNSDNGSLIQTNLATTPLQEPNR